MNANELIALRPKERTLAALADSRSRIALAENFAKGRIAELEAGMSDLMMKGTASEINAAREETALCERNILELASLEMGLQREETLIRQEEALEHHRRLFEKTEAVTKQWIEWQSTKYPLLAAELASGLQLDEVAIAAHHSAMTARRRDAKLLEGAELPNLTSPREPFRNMTTPSFSETVRLPGIKGGPHTTERDTPFWEKIDRFDDYKRNHMVKDRELLSRQAQIEHLQSENAQLRATLSTVGLSPPVGQSGVVMRSGVGPNAVARAWDAVMRQVGE